MQFTYKAYEKMIILLTEAGYQMTDYHKYSHMKYPCIIRHDVDFSLEKAAQFAKWEKQIFEKIKGYKGIYFVLVTSDFYNIFSKKSQGFLKQIIENGHEIGLHFDEKRYESGDIRQYIYKEIALLENVLEQKIRTVSMHRPSPEVLEADLDLGIIINSYGKRFFQDFKYVSDSRMHWRENVESIIRSRSYPALHILTHPIWYTKEEQQTREKIMNFINRAKLECYDHLNENFRDLQEFVRREEL